MAKNEVTRGTEKKDKAAAKAKPARKPRAPRKSPVALIKEIIAELKKVTWPSRREVTSYSVVVVVFMAIMAGVLVLMDTVFSRLLNLILSI